MSRVGGRMERGEREERLWGGEAGRSREGKEGERRQARLSALNLPVWQKCF